MEPPVWHTLVVLVWRDGDGLKVRFLAGRTGGRQTTQSLATTVEAATGQFIHWLRSTDHESDGGGGPAPLPEGRDEDASADGR